MKHTLSIPPWMDEFLEVNPQLSCSKMLQSKIIEIREKQAFDFSEVRNLRRKLEHSAKLLSDAYKKIQELEQCSAKKS